MAPPKRNPWRRWLLPLLAAAGAFVAVGVWLERRTPTALWKIGANANLLDGSLTDTRAFLRHTEHFTSTITEVQIASGAEKEVAKFTDRHDGKGHVLGILPATPPQIIREKVNVAGPSNFSSVIEALGMPRGDVLRRLGPERRVTGPHRASAVGRKFLMARGDAEGRAGFQLLICDALDGRTLAEGLVESAIPTARPARAMLSPDERWAAVQLAGDGKDSSAHETVILDAETGAVRKRFARRCAVPGCWSQDGRRILLMRLASAGEEPAAEVWDWQADQTLSLHSLKHEAAPARSWWIGPWDEERGLLILTEFVDRRHPQPQPPSWIPKPLLPYFGFGGGDSAWLWSLSLASGERRLVGAGTFQGQATLTPDGTRVLAREWHITKHQQDDHVACFNAEGIEVVPPWQAAAYSLAAGLLAFALAHRLLRPGQAPPAAT